jgi:hypothetical protein
MKFNSKMVALMSCLIAAIGVTDAESRPADEPFETLTLDLTRQPATDEEIVLRLALGILPRGTRVVVRTADGEIVGTASPYGLRPGQKAGTHTIPVPDKAVTGNKVTLRIEVLDKGSGKPRSPLKGEVDSTKLDFVKVTPLPEPIETSGPR